MTTKDDAAVISSWSRLGLEQAGSARGTEITAADVPLTDDDRGKLGSAVASALGDAAREILTVSPEATVRLAMKALTMTRKSAATPSAYVMTVIDGHLAMGHFGTAIALMREIPDQQAPAEVTAQLRFKLALALVATGRAAEAVEIFGRSSGPRGGLDDLDDACVAVYLLALLLSDRDQARSEVTNQLRRRWRGDTEAIACAKACLADFLWEDGDADHALLLAEQAVGHADWARSPIWRVNCRLARARMLISLGRYSQAKDLLAGCAGDFRQLGPVLHEVAPALMLSRLLMHRGQLAEAREKAEFALRSARETDTQLLTPLALYAMANVTLRIGDLAASQECLDAARHLPGVGGTPSWAMHWRWIQVRLAAERDGPQRAASLLTSECPWLVGCSSLFLDEAGAAAWFVRLGIAVGNVELAGRATRIAEELARRNPGLWQIAISSQHARALIEADPDLFAGPIERHRDHWARALALEDLAMVLARPRTAVFGLATRQFHAALNTFEKMGAERDAERIRGELRGLGIPSPDEAHIRKVWDEFGESERVVATLVSQGFTNFQVASRMSRSEHTVNYHLRKLFRKFGVGSRVELARIVNEILKSE